MSEPSKNRTPLVGVAIVFILLALGIVALLFRQKSGIGSGLPGPGTTDYKEAVSAFYVGSIALESGKDDIAQAELTKVTQLAPKEAAAWANLGLYAIRHQQQDQAAKYLKQASELAPNNEQIEEYYALLARSDPGNAIPHLKKVLEIDPRNLRARYALADAIEQIHNPDSEYQQQIEEILKQQPENIQALIDLARIASKQNNKEVVLATLNKLGEHSADWSPDAKTELNLLQKLAATNPHSAAKEVPKLGNLLKTTLSWQQSNRALISPPDKVGTPMLRLLTLPNPSPLPAASDTGLTYAPQPASVNGLAKAGWAAPIALDGENAPAVFAANGAQVKSTTGVALTWPGIGGATMPTPAGVVAFDANYDFKTDLALAGTGGLKLYQQSGKGAFTDVTAKTKLPASVAKASLYGAWAMDVEADGDLDLVVAPQAGPVQTLRNNGDGTWKPLTTFSAVKNARAFAWADFDGDGDADAAFLDADGKLTLFSNDRSGLYHVRPVPDGLGKLVALAVADINNDGVMDLVALKADGSLIAIWDQNNGTGWIVKPLGAWTNPPANLTPGTVSLFAADLDNNGSVDLLASAPGGTQIWLSDAKGQFAPLAAKIDARIYGVADMNGDGVLDLTGVDADGKPVTLLGSSPKKYRWQEVRPTADKSGKGDSRINSFGVGGEIELRAGLLYQKQPIAGPRVHFGLGENEAAQVARIIWPNGSSQAEFPDANTNGLKAGQVVVMNQRLISSCPWLFAWNGTAMQLVTDCIWRSPLGLKINAQDTAGVAQTSDWVHIRGDQLAPRDGVYDLRITAELWETHFFDYLDLMTVDHPANTEVYVDERFAIPPPPLALHVTTPVQPVAKATDDMGTDVTDIVNKRDGRYLDTFGRGQYQGVTRDHWVEVELPDSAPTDKPLNLIATGWIHPTDSSINVAISQGSHEPPKGLSLEAPDGKGGWHTVKPGLGFPEGKIKTIVLDLNGVFKPGVPRRLRLRTNLEIYWDFLGWATVLPDAPVKKTHAPMQAADLLYRGFSTTHQADRSSPELPDYDHVAGTAPNWRDLIGYYTRWGDVRELLGKLDDRYVIMNAGDELRLRFAEQPAPPKGWVRDYILIGDGWVKDGNLNTAFSKSVCPLPTHKVVNYTVPPGRLEDDPVYKQHRGDWETYHTRYVSPERFRNLLKPALPTEAKETPAKIARDGSAPGRVVQEFIPATNGIN